MEHDALAQFSADGWLQALAQCCFRPIRYCCWPRTVARFAPGYPGWRCAGGCRWSAAVCASASSATVTLKIRHTHGGAVRNDRFGPYATLICAMLTPGVRGGCARPGRTAKISVVHPALDPPGDRTLRTLSADPRTVAFETRPNGSFRRFRYRRAGRHGTGEAIGSTTSARHWRHLVAADRGWLAWNASSVRPVRSSPQVVHGVRRVRRGSTSIRYHWQRDRHCRQQRSHRADSQTGGFGVSSATCIKSCRSCSANCRRSPPPNAENHSEPTAPTGSSVAHRTLEMTP